MKCHKSQLKCPEGAECFEAVEIAQKLQNEICDQEHAEEQWISQCEWFHTIK